MSDLEKFSEIMLYLGQLKEQKESTKREVFHLKNKIARLEKALALYADVDNWKTIDALKDGTIPWIWAMQALGKRKITSDKD